MTYVVLLFLVGLIMGVIAVASNPAPYFAAFGLVLVAGLGCGVLAGHGGSFLSLVLFLIYLGGMLVVFAYSAALAAEPFPEGWGSGPVMKSTLAFGASVLLFSVLFWESWYDVHWSSVEEYGEFSVGVAEVGGMALMYSSGGGMLIISVWVLLLALFVVLELTRGLSRGALRAV
uniref:NADH-ubiquinone oxidoreductase chain 6 n=1 Tax=Triacanthus biaculeatus TaxID=384595 RepID=A4QJ42_TRIBT|nr:NADH dehydrogenase subunit 6 [Triacanthus biaculeatus]BAF51905.1 NADH dehydrogenase subunit 6 [Triacanthus biaculeatus]